MRAEAVYWFCCGLGSMLALSGLALRLLGPTEAHSSAGMWTLIAGLAIFGAGLAVRYVADER